MFGLSLGHLIVLGVIVLLFGGKKLPELGEGIGKGLRAFKKAYHEDPVMPPHQPHQATLTEDKTNLLPPK